MDVDILREKIAYGFDHLDVDGDGLLSERDHVVMGARNAAALGHLPGSPTEQRMVEAYLNVWRELHAPYATRPEGITRDEFMASTLALAADPAAADRILGGLARRFFEIADVDRDGVINPLEYAAFLKGFMPRLPERDVEEAFAHLDRSHDGTITHEELRSACIEYWTSSDPDAPGNWWLGKPVYLRRAAAEN